MKSRRIDNAGAENAQINAAKKYNKMKYDLELISEEIAEMSFMGEAESGKIRVLGMGDKRIVEVTFDEDFLREKGFDDKQIDVLRKEISDLLAAATNDVISKIDDYTDKRIDQLTKGMQIPGFSGF